MNRQEFLESLKTKLRNYQRSEVKLESYRRYIELMVEEMESVDEFSTSNDFRDRLHNYKNQLKEIDDFVRLKLEIMLAEVPESEQVAAAPMSATCKQSLPVGMQELEDLEASDEAAEPRKQSLPRGMQELEDADDEAETK